MVSSDVVDVWADAVINVVAPSAKPRSTTKCMCTNIAFNLVDEHKVTGGVGSHATYAAP